MRRKAEERTKRRVEEPASKFGSFLEEEEYKDPISSSSEEEEGMETPSQLDLVNKSELPPFEIHRPTIRSTLGRSTARSKRKATKKKLEGPRSSTRKKRRG